jgi:hypothetical protein
MKKLLESLNSDEIKNICKNIAEFSNYTVSITLVTGEILFGDLRPEMRFFDELPDENLWWVARKNDNKFCSIKLDPGLLIFNTEDGKMYGDSYTISLKNELISDIKPITWIEDFKNLRWVKNPYAKIICRNNLKIAENNELYIGWYGEYSLITEGLGSSGITFTKDEIISIDWEFMNRLTGGTSVSLGYSGASIKPARTVYNLALDKLKEGYIEKIVSFLPGSSPMGEKRIMGHLVMLNSKTDTKIEGYEWNLALCCVNPEFNKEEKYLPVLIKKDSLSYPEEYLPFIKSKLIFYGEIKQIPINEGEIYSNEVLLVRAIGYIHKI